MTFLSVDFAIFFAFVLLTIPLAKYHKPFYISAISALFYAFAGWQLLLIAIISSTTDQYCSKKIKSQNLPKTFLTIGIALNLLLLIAVKINYFVFSDTIQVSSIVPIGISFYSLQSISYLIDVYKRKITPAESYLEYLSYILFFPQLIAGPIERAGSLLPQLKDLRIAPSDDVLLGVKLFTFGAYLKLVLSNRMASQVETVAASTSFDILFTLNGVLVFLYVYCDFFAYTLMARGLAKMLNIDLQINFDKPFSRKNLISFWQSWHISLTKWMVDYFYIPIVMKTGNIRIFKIIFSILAMILIGFWHGLTLNFVLFGLINGALMQTLPALQNGLNRISMGWLKVNGRMGILFTLALSGNIFLAGSFEQLTALTRAESYEILNAANLATLTKPSFLVVPVFLVPLAFHEFTRSNILIEKTRPLIDVGIVASLLIAIAIAHTAGKAHVYFQF